jgi:molybdopterin-containing oxidoreductase family iron-sulfur binding subunit
MRVEIGRRQALKLLATAMMAPLAACSPPDEKIIPYVDMPEGMVAGEPMRFATTLQLSGYARGFLGITVDGRPIKIEGNPRHPFGLGATDLFAEAEVLSLYDPDRSRTVSSRDGMGSPDAFRAAWASAAADGKDALALVTGRVVGPVTLSRIAALRKRFPGLRWYRYEPVNDDAARAGARLAFGRVVTSLIRWREADVILSLDADPLGPGPDQLRIARAHAARRDLQHRQRLYAVEPVWSLTGAAADFRLALTPAAIVEVARLIANSLGSTLGEPALDEPARGFAENVAHALVAARGRAVVVAGERLGPEVHALCHWINAELKAPVSLLRTADPAESDHGQALIDLATDLHDGRIKSVIVADANPVYDAPDALGMAEALRSAAFSAHLGLYADETAACCAWHLPLSHALESWGDGIALDDTASFVQPLIRRLYDTQTRDEFLAGLAGEPDAKAYDLVRATWRDHAVGDFESWWRQALHDGVVAGTTAAPLDLALRRPPSLPRQPAQTGATLALSPHATVWDGRFANNAWLQECPQPFTKEVWGNAVQLAPGDAARLGIGDGDAITMTVGTGAVTAATTIMPGQAEGVIAASWGQGRSCAGRIGNGIGVRCSKFGTQPFVRLLPLTDIKKSDRGPLFHSTQGHTRLNGRAEELFPIATPADLGKPRAPEENPPSLLAIPARGERAWAMVIDSDACIGCNACVIACQAENNVPIVGPDEILQGRDMHWLRIDSYALAEQTPPRRGFQPVPCMHCELAPCEPVCPVEASVHDHEGLNVQVYNRCIGTRFCEANCPYKVRRFNYFAYADGQAYADESAALKAQHNPDVSSRGRGVMEKCNYCLQRISRGRRAAEKDDRPIADGEVVTACQSACPTRAIHFGDLNQKESAVSTLRRAPQHYALLAELNTRPRTTYLKRVYENDEKFR